MNKTILSFAVLGILTVAMPAKSHAREAGRITLDINVGSYHTQAWARRDLNQKNPGLGVTYHVDRTWAFAGGGYWNSYRRPTAYALVQWTPLQLGGSNDWHVDAGLVAGLASGYRYDEIAVRPLAGGALVRLVAPSGVSLNLYGVPGTGGSKSGFVGVQFSVPMR